MRTQNRRNAQNILFVKSEGKKSLGRQRFRRKYNPEMDFREI
jgi:hypothetical protein